MLKLIKSSNYHRVKNFPKDFTLFSRILSNVVFFILTTKTSTRPNKLSKEDMSLSSNEIQKGDVILAGDFTRVSRFFTGKQFTHALLYVGKNKCIHATIDGVGTTSFKKLFKEYDTLLIMRPNIVYNYEQSIERVVALAKEKIGLSYNFHFESRDDRFICTQLIETVFCQAGFDLNIGKRPKLKSGPFHIISRMRNIVRADDLLKGDFRLVFGSKEVKKKEFFKQRKKLKI